MTQAGTTFDHVVQRTGPVQKDGTSCSHLSSHPYQQSHSKHRSLRHLNNRTSTASVSHAWSLTTYAWHLQRRKDLPNSTHTAYVGHAQITPWSHGLYLLTTALRIRGSTPHLFQLRASRRLSLTIRSAGSHSQFRGDWLSKDYTYRNQCPNWHREAYIFEHLHRRQPPYIFSHSTVALDASLGFLALLRSGLYADTRLLLFSITNSSSLGTYGAPSTAHLNVADAACCRFVKFSMLGLEFIKVAGQGSRHETHRK